MFYFSPQCLISNNRYSVKNVKIATTMSIHPFVCFKDQRKPDIAFCDKIIPNCFACGRCSFLFLICLFFPSLRKSLHCDRYFSTRVEWVVNKIFTGEIVSITSGDITRVVCR